MKIALVVDDTLDKPDGVQQYVLTLGGWLASQGHTVHYLAGASKRDDLAHIYSLSRNVAVKFNGNRLTIPLPARMAPIRSLLQEQQYDVIHVQMPYSPMLAHKIIKVAAGMEQRPAIVGTFHILPHGRMATAGSHVLARWLASTRRQFDAVFAVSEAARQFAERSFGFRGMNVLPNVIDVAHFANVKPHASLVRSDLPVVLFLGRLVPRKGCGTLLQAVAQLRRTHGSATCKLVVCGKGPLLAGLQAESKRLGIGDQVDFVGFVSEADKPSYLAAADIAVFPSLGGESFGIVLTEAMAANGPVVLAGDNAGYRSVLGGRPELLFEPGDASALAAKLDHFMYSKTACRAARRWQDGQIGQYDVAVVGRQLVAVYQQQLDRIRGGS